MLSAALEEGFDTATNVVAWLSVLLRLVQYMLFGKTAAWKRTTFLTLAALVGMLGLYWQFKT